MIDINICVMSKIDMEYKYIRTGTCVNISNGIIVLCVNSYVYGAVRDVLKTMIQYFKNVF